MCYLNPATELLAHAGRLLLEYNDSTKDIHRTLENTSRALTSEKCDLVVSYGGVAVSLGGNGPLLMPVRELRYNAALQARVHSILAHVCDGTLGPSAALVQLQQVEANTPRHPRWLAAVLLGLAASGLAKLLGGDNGAVLIAGLSTALGLAARQWLGRRKYNLLMLPLTAAFIGAVLGGLAIRLGWTQTPGLVLIAPSLMLVPGPHLINGLLDVVDNFMPIGIARLGLALSILLACALGIVVGMKITLPVLPMAEEGMKANQLNLLSDMVLAGIVTIGFAVFYNAAWLHVGLATVGGMIGHGLRYMALEVGWNLDAATFLGSFAVGLVAAWIARSYKLPVAVVSFAGAVTMMPGIQMYRALGGALRLARAHAGADSADVARTVGYALQACLVVAALAMGLVLAARIVPMFARQNESLQSEA
jgi:uncharacterized membrane protein YjjP (DUF1212 family)